eukprot:10647885-Lingulodinium_polyedra.AAC.1
MLRDPNSRPEADNVSTGRQTTSVRTRAIVGMATWIRTQSTSIFVCSEEAQDEKEDGFLGRERH